MILYVKSLASRGSLWSRSQVQVGSSGVTLTARAKWEEFTSWYENTPTYVSKGWPWPHPGTANDKQVLLAEDTPKWQFLKAQPTSCLSDEGRVAKEKRLAGKRPRDEPEVY